MISCPAYGLPVTPAQCEEAPKQFWKAICGGCGKEKISASPPPSPEAGGTPALREEGVKERFRRRKLPPGMTPAVARAMGLG
ncbi:MAG: hypothetical protein A2Y80_02240 [Deltaproteobacteria bacterium RBG_13_58_19]|nr:MAG: hypothetical protein A2Y80_02240 [Deltaproteobacteria bacterium RBG_13_58_19]